MLCKCVNFDTVFPYWIGFVCCLFGFILGEGKRVFVRESRFNLREIAGEEEEEEHRGEIFRAPVRFAHVAEFKGRKGGIEFDVNNKVVIRWLATVFTLG